MGRITIQNLSKTYTNRRRFPRGDDDPQVRQGERITVLKGINLEIENGEMVCFLGPSGCGKSTLLRIIAGFEPACGGVVQVNGQPVTGPSADHIFVFQHSGLFPWMTVAENVGLGLRHLKNHHARQAQVTEFIEMVELEGFEHHYPRQLSGGMQRRAELARALAVNPDIMIMDEPFSGLDFLTHMKMREEVVNMHAFIRKTMLLVTHNIDDALIMGDHIVILGSSPTAVTMDRILDFPRPRNFEKSPELSRLRSELFLMLGINYAV
ncbi:nitrate ABC transporter ATP-binding protein [Desulfosarcina ovata subsp. sediminis]|uniref:Nitrate ABC transporter ATP-binding protein n=1 Tax=Desulfosarcina ovata subsp. sediminis TaxID=885957 RepID=A0A5K7ZD10_9BACT|nr:ABC transporter ATP-binding protein [Desulfosarcina ovata]BBO79882.1 nitrate ABC transporter ATP-binding protein [Desulfosarcina ovata subsp. sediminis]